MGRGVEVSWELWVAIQKVWVNISSQVFHPLLHLSG